MDKIYKYIAFFFVIICSNACQSSSYEKETINYSKNEIELIIEIPKASCNNCKKTIEKGLVKKEGIKFCEYSISSKKLTLIYDSSLISVDHIKHHITLLTYQIPCR